MILNLIIFTPIDPNGPSYLFSAVFNNATFNRNETGGTLTITRDDTESIIQFSDRPFRQTENIDFDTFVSLFSNSVSSGDNSFEEDPPNGVLTHNEEQRTYIIRLLNSNIDSATFSFELLPGESHNLNTVSGRMNLFVDGSSSSSSSSSTITITNISWKYNNDSTPEYKSTNYITIGNYTINTNSSYNLDTLIRDINNQGKNTTISAPNINPNKTNSIKSFNFESGGNTAVTSNDDNALMLGYYVYLDSADSMRHFLKGNTLSIEISY